MNRDREALIWTIIEHPALFPHPAITLFLPRRRLEDRPVATPRGA
jgi:hypothetical protein